MEDTKELFKIALEKQYVSCMFDVDGTLTIRGEEYIPANLQSELARVSMNFPVALCTARSLQHALEKISPVFIRCASPLTSQLNFLLVCENGSIGYSFDQTTRSYGEFFRATYPYSEEHRINLFNTIKKTLALHIGQAEMNVIELVFRPVGFDDPDHEAVSHRSHELELMIKKEITLLDPKNLLDTGDSGMGVNIFPHSGNKLNGIREFAKYLRNYRGLIISDNASEIVVIGDQPEPDGNDEAFLSGQMGTPFTAGQVGVTPLIPLPVYDEAIEKIIYGPEATLSLLKRLKFKYI